MGWQLHRRRTDDRSESLFRHLGYQRSDAAVHGHGVRDTDTGCSLEYAERGHHQCIWFVHCTGGEPLGFARKALERPPYRFTFEIPSGITPGTYALTAMGFTSPEHPVKSNPVISDPVTILVERAESPVSISVYPPLADFTMTEKRYLQVTGLYADKTTADLTQSNRIRFVSSAPNVATVQAQGIVTPVSPGTGKITITYGDLKLEVPVRVSGSR